MSLYKKNIFSVLLIFAVAFIIYSNSFDASFHFDDQHAIVENYTIHRFDLKNIFTYSGRPVLDFTFALNYYFGRLDVFGYHLVNLLLHISNGVMLYFILQNTIISMSNGQGSGNEKTDSPYYVLYDNFRVPLYASLIFIAHPIQTESVTYIVSRSEVLASFFYLLAIFLFIHAYKQGPCCCAKKEEGAEGSAKGPVQSAVSSRLYCAGAIVSSCLGMGTKQIAITLPVMILLYDYYFIAGGDRRSVLSRYGFHLAMFSTISVVLYRSFSGILEFVSFDYSKGIPMPIKEAKTITSFQYFLTQLHVIPYYIKLLFVPTNLNLDYDWPLTGSIDLLTVFFFLLLSGILVAGIMIFRRSRLISFGILWFFITLSVTSSFLVIHDFIFEHRLYLPSVGFAIIIAVLISRISAIRLKST